MFKTRITEMFGIEYPIIQGGLMWLARAELAAAVAEAGGIGFMTALTHSTPGGLRDEIKKVRDLTDKPFGVNLTFLPSLRPTDFPAYFKVCIDEGVKFVETAGRNPEAFMPLLNGAGIKVIHKCTSIRHALKARKIGCAALQVPPDGVGQEPVDRLLGVGIPGPDHPLDERVAVFPHLVGVERGHDQPQIAMVTSASTVPVKAPLRTHAMLRRAM